MKENNKNVEVQLYFKDIPTSNLKYPTSNSAITLIALIITIIVLLILAGVSLNMLVGENGIISKAQLAKEKTNQTQEQEEKNLKDLESKMDETLQKQNGSSKFEVLWENTTNEPITVGKEFELKEEFTNYDVLSVNFRTSEKFGTYEDSINTKDLKNIIDENLAEQNHWYCGAINNSVNSYVYINFSKDYKKWYVKYRNGSSALPYLINSITGIKY